MTLRTWPVWWLYWLPFSLTKGFREEFIWAYGSRGWESTMVQWRQQEAGTATERVGSLHLANQAWSRENKQEIVLITAFKLSKCTPAIYFLYKATPPKPFQTVPLTGEQVFRYLSLWGHFTTKLAHPSKFSMWLLKRKWSVIFFLLSYSTQNNLPLHWDSWPCPQPKSPSKLEFS